MIKRRDFAKTALAVGTAWHAACRGTAAGFDPQVDETLFDETATDKSADDETSPLRQSVMGWCFNPMSAETLAGHCRDIGLAAMEGIADTAYPNIRQRGLAISLVGSHGFRTGPVDPENHATVETQLRRGIDLAVRWGAPNVITFTGMRADGISDASSRSNCLRCWKRVLPYAEAKGIGIVLEHLNSKAHRNHDGSIHPMKGHPGYWGDDIHQCADLVRAMASDHFKLLFDVYHVQVMNGDVIANLRRYQDLIGHYHTAGNPGRGPLDDEQEINYPAVFAAIKQTGFNGYVAHEFIPTGDDPIASLRQAYELCKNA